MKLAEGRAFRGIQGLKGLNNWRLLSYIYILGISTAVLRARSGGLI